MLSRVADAVYWMSRYVERAENVARFVDVNLNLLLESPSGKAPGWEPLVLTTGDQRWFLEHYGDFGAEAVTRFLTFDREYANSIISSVANARENARTVRDIISREMWQQLNEFYLMVKEASEHPAAVGDMSDFYGRVKLFGIYFEGVTNATLSRGEAWHFSQLGRMIERADKTSRIVDVKYYILLPSVREVGTNVDQLGWAALLSSASALQMYRQRYRVTTPTNVVEFLLLDKDFPRAIRYCVSEAKASLLALTQGSPGTNRTDVERRLGALGRSLESADVEQIFARGLHEYLDGLQTELNEVGGALSRTFFQVGPRSDAAAPAAARVEP